MITIRINDENNLGTKLQAIDLKSALAGLNYYVEELYSTETELRITIKDEE